MQKFDLHKQMCYNLFISYRKEGFHEIGQKWSDYNSCTIVSRGRIEFFFQNGIDKNMIWQAKI